MRTKLITALRLTAKAIEIGTFGYNWKKTDSCNCGALACTLTGMSAWQMRVAICDSMGDAGATWKEKVGRYCPITGMPANWILQVMCKAGMTPQDIVDLEYLRNPEVLKRITMHPGDRFWNVDIRPSK